VIAVVEKLHELGAPSESARRRLTELTELLESKDGDSTDHATAVAGFAVAIGTELGIGRRRLRHVELGALLHDVGKVCVPNRILRKRSPLNELEWLLMRRHCVSGERMIIRILDLPDVLAIVRSHHERWDGRGYPDELLGEEIPFGARIVAVADSFQAMLEHRPYRRALDPAEAFAELIRNAGTQFDPTCVDALRCVLERREQEGPRR
jgi:HD-GYP domain-containing protein (c-di-GMP phosphodiesterase class II)